MQRRNFIAALGCMATALPLSASVQQKTGASVAGGRFCQLWIG
jgi:hypothetical protein